MIRVYAMWKFIPSISRFNACNIGYVFTYPGSMTCCLFSRDFVDRFCRGCLFRRRHIRQRFSADITAVTVIPVPSTWKRRFIRIVNKTCRLVHLLNWGICIGERHRYNTIPYGCNWHYYKKYRHVIGNLTSDCSDLPCDERSRTLSFIEGILWYTLYINV